jgi:hypothetical protein
MPVKSYYKGHGRKVMRSMKKKYGSKQGASIFYATVNSMRKGSAAQRAAQPKRAPGSGRRTRKK